LNNLNNENENTDSADIIEYLIDWYSWLYTA